MRYSITFTNEGSLLVDLLPFLGPLLGASITLFVGFVFYKYQKKLDMREQIHAEKRKLYGKFLMQFDIVSTKRDGHFHVGNDEWIVFLGIMAEIQLLSNEALVEVCFEAEDIIKKLGKPDVGAPSTTDVMAQREELIAAMRDELGIENDRRDRKS